MESTSSAEELYDDSTAAKSQQSQKSESVPGHRTTDIKVRWGQPDLLEQN